MRSMYISLDMHRLVLPILFLTFLIFTCSPRKNEAIPEKDLIPYTVLKVFPHDVTAFTQGLTVNKGRLYESTGQANSWIAEVDIATGKQDKKIVLDKKYFGEGITFLNNKIYQLTWQNHVGFVYYSKTFDKLREFQYGHEGWGITHNEKNLIISDGTEKLYFLDTLTLKIADTLLVMDHGIATDNLNELEFIEGYLYANRWQTNLILKIDPASGNVVGKIDLSPLYEKARQMNSRADVLNGIAYEKKTGILLVTGKLWPALFAIRLQKMDTISANSK